MDVKKIIKEWNLVSEKKFDGQEWLLEMELEYIDRRITEDMIIGAIQNYKKARDLRITQAWPWNLFHFIRRGYKNYLPGVFDIDHFNGRKFGKKPPPLTSEQMTEKLRQDEIRWRQEKRKEYGQYFRERTIETLKKWRNDKRKEGDWWLIDEILKEKGGGK